MTDFNQTPDVLNLEIQDNKQLPSMLNVLTILTYIGCAIGFLGSIYSYFTICKSVETLTSSEMPEMGGAIGKMMDQAIELSIKQCDNRLVTLVASLVSTVLCFLGAMMMRKLQKQGFIVYTIGELIGPLAMIVILGVSSIGGMMLFGLVVNIIFVILYFTQRKYLIK